MTFLHLSPLQLFAAFAGVVGVLYLLQRLRVRHRDVLVITTLFWQQAVEESRARVLTRRFRHPWAFLLIATIAGLLLFALAGPKQSSTDPTNHVIYLDTSAAMAGAGRFEQALTTMDEAVAALPRERTRVVQVGADTRTLLLPGEAAELLPHRLRGVTPEACPPSVERALRAEVATFVSRSQESEGPSSLAVWIVGYAPVAAETLALLPKSVQVRRVQGSGEPIFDLASGSVRRVASPAIVALGISEAASGAWSAVDVLVTARGDGAGLRVTLDDAPLERPAPVLGADGLRSIVLRDVPARGGLLRAQVDSDPGSPLDDEAEIRLPDRPRIRVRVDADLQAMILPALLADPAVVLAASGEDADVSIHRAGTSLADGATKTAAALTLVDPSDQEDAFVILHGPDDEPGDVLQSGLEALGLLEIDATGLATQAGQEIRVGTREADARGLSVWTTLFGDAYDFRSSRAFPLFLARAVRYLGGGDPIMPRIAAGEPIAGAASATDAAGQLLDAAGADFVPTRAGAYTTADGTILHAALLGKIGAGDDAPTLWPGPLGEAGAGLSLIHLIGLLAFALMCIEWLLFRTERIP